MKHQKQPVDKPAPMQTRSQRGGDAARHGQQPQNQQRLGQHQNSRKQPH